MSDELNSEFQGAIQNVLEEIYRKAYIDISEQMKLPYPVTTKGLLGDPDVFLQKVIPTDTPEAEAKRRRAVGARIKARRKQMGLTQAEVAQKLGIASQSVTNYESGKTDPSIRNLISLAAVLGVSTDYLLGRSVNACC